MKYIILEMDISSAQSIILPLVNNGYVISLAKIPNISSTGTELSPKNCKLYIGIKDEAIKETIDE